MTAPAELSRRQVLSILSGLLMGLFLAAMDQTIVATALPTIVGELGNITQLSWVVTAYLITTTASTPLYGKLGDIYGRRIVFQVAICVFVVGSLLCGIAQSMPQLIAARAIQGIGGGGLMALAFAIVGDILSPRERGRYMGYFSATFAVAGVVGPVVGGFFVDHVSWRGAFLINLPIGLVALVVVSAHLHLPRRSTARAVDYLGGALLVASVSCLMLVSVWGGKQYEWGSTQILSLIAAAVVLAVLFVIRERSAREPMLPLRMFTNRVVGIAVVVGFVVSTGMFVSTIFLPLFLQAVSGVSATNSGLLIAPTMAGVTISSIVVGRRMTKTGRYKRYLVGGTVLGVVSVAALATIGAGTEVAFIGAAMFVLGMGMGAAFPILNMAAQNAVDFSDIGTATSTVRFSQSLGGTLGIAAAGAFMASRLQSGLDALGGAGLDAERIANSPAQIRALAEPLRSGVIGSLADAVAFIFLLAIPLMIVAVVLCLWMPEIPLRTTITTPPAAPDGPATVPPGPPSQPVPAAADARSP